MLYPLPGRFIAEIILSKSPSNSDGSSGFRFSTSIATSNEDHFGLGAPVPKDVPLMAGAVGVPVSNVGLIFAFALYSV
jgi:hypothetical protein